MVLSKDSNKISQRRNKIKKPELFDTQQFMRILTCSTFLNFDDTIRFISK